MAINQQLMAVESANVSMQTLQAMSAGAAAMKDFQHKLY